MTWRNIKHKLVSYKVDHTSSYILTFLTMHWIVSPRPPRCMQDLFQQAFQTIQICQPKCYPAGRHPHTLSTWRHKLTTLAPARLHTSNTLIHKNQRTSLLLPFLSIPGITHTLHGNEHNTTNTRPPRLRGCQGWTERIVTTDETIERDDNKTNARPESKPQRIRTKKTKWCTDSIVLYDICSLPSIYTVMRVKWTWMCKIW